MALTSYNMTKKLRAKAREERENRAAKIALDLYENGIIANTSQRSISGEKLRMAWENYVWGELARQAVGKDGKRGSTGTTGKGYDSGDRLHMADARGWSVDIVDIACRPAGQPDITVQCDEKAAELLDILCVPMGLLLCALYLGQQDTGLGIGKIVEEGTLTQALPWLFLCERMGVNVEYRMLVYLYQAILSAVIAIALIAVYLRVQKKAGFRAGETGLLALALYGCVMVVLESLRRDLDAYYASAQKSSVSAALRENVGRGDFATDLDYLRVLQDSLEKGHEQS